MVVAAINITSICSVFASGRTYCRCFSAANLKGSIVYTAHELVVVVPAGLRLEADAPDLLLSCSLDATVRGWDLRIGQQIQQ